MNERNVKLLKVRKDSKKNIYLNFFQIAMEAAGRRKERGRSGSLDVSENLKKLDLLATKFIPLHLALKSFP